MEKKPRTAMGEEESAHHKWSQTAAVMVVCGRESFVEGLCEGNNQKRGQMPHKTVGVRTGFHAQFMEVPAIVPPQAANTVPICCTGKPHHDACSRRAP